MKFIHGNLSPQNVLVCRKSEANENYGKHLTKTFWLETGLIVQKQPCTFLQNWVYVLQNRTETDIHWFYDISSNTSHGGQNPSFNIKVFSYFFYFQKCFVTSTVFYYYENKENDTYLSIPPLVNVWLPSKYNLSGWDFLDFRTEQTLCHLYLHLAIRIMNGLYVLGWVKLCDQ